MGVLKGYQTYDKAKSNGTSIQVFAKFVARRRVLDAITDARRKHRLPQEPNASLQDKTHTGSTETWEQTIPSHDPTADPHAKLTLRQELAALTDAINNRLTPIERQAILATAIEGRAVHGQV
jgi:DNA-directed RNA polymerase specialized sigma24 family protein